MNKLSTQRRAQVIAALVDGNSIRATSRITQTAKGTVLRLLREVGEACAEYQDKMLRGLQCKRIQCDEIWSFCYAKQKNVPKKYKGTFGYGDVWTWVAIDAKTKLVPSWHIGWRNAGDAYEFMTDLAGRLSNRVQLTTDGLKVYLDAVEGAFGSEIDYAMLIKIYGSEPMTEARYSPPKCIGTETTVIQGKPNPKKISTSYIERQNLTMRMSMRRFTRLTNGFSKKVENLRYAVAIHFMYYNFCRIHASVKKTPAMAAGLAEWPWSVEDIVSLLDSK